MNWNDIDWNQTGAMITAWATVFLAILTGIYVKLTSDSVKKTAESIQEQVRPYAFATIALEDRALVLHIGNSGKRTACDVKISFTPDITNLEKDYENDPDYSVKESLNHKSIAPGSSIKRDLMHSGCFSRIDGFYSLKGKKGDVPRNYNIRVDYYDSNGQAYSESFKGDFMVQTLTLLN